MLPKVNNYCVWSMVQCNGQLQGNHYTFHSLEMTLAPCYIYHMNEYNLMIINTFTPLVNQLWNGGEGGGGAGGGLFLN